MANYGGYGYQYETSPKKLQPEYVPTKKAKKKTNVKSQNTKKPSKQQKNKYNYKPVVYIGLAFVMLFTISYRYSLINEEYNSKENIKSKVSAVQKENGRLCIITFHSLEDRAVKNAYIEAQGHCTCPKELPYCVCNYKSYGKIINKKPIEATEQEKEENSRSKSAKLRIFERHEKK